MTEQLTLIPRVEEGEIIPQRLQDGYIDATALCKSVNKNFSDYRKLQSTQNFLDELSKQTNIRPELLIHSIVGGNPSLQGTWVHPFLATHLAQWLSPKFAVKVAQWVAEWQSGQFKLNTTYHLKRYTANLDKVPYTHFSMLNEITLHLIAPLEQQGYILPDNLVPDISQGKFFSKWLRENRGIEPKNFPTYKHAYEDGRVVDARLYPIEYLADFRIHFNEFWLATQAQRYFKPRDAAILPFIMNMQLQLSS